MYKKTMKDVIIAVDIIKRKIQENKKIRIIGDYDKQLLI